MAYFVMIKATLQAMLKWRTAFHSRISILLGMCTLLRFGFFFSQCALFILQLHKKRSTVSAFDPPLSNVLYLYPLRACLLLKAEETLTRIWTQVIWYA